jgi:prepilin-type N-terminal cleavage/methylation domain-containing protein
MVLTIISIMAALVINAFTNAAKDTADIISRQQQAVLKSALDNAISQYMVGGKTVADARNYYNYSDVAAGTERTTLERLALVETFLDPDTYAHFIENSSDTQVRSSAMVNRINPQGIMQYAATIHQGSRGRGFSLVEVLAAVAIIGVITFLALPNIITIRQGAEENLAITRAEAVNMAIASFIQSRGRSNAEATWDAAATKQQYYSLLAPFLAFAPAVEAQYMPTDYTIGYPGTLASLTKVTLTGPAGTIGY